MFWILCLKHNGTSLYDEQYFAKYQIKSGSFQVALNGLTKKDIIDKNGLVFYICDPLFEYWIKRN